MPDDNTNPTPSMPPVDPAYATPTAAMDAPVDASTSSAPAEQVTPTPSSKPVGPDFGSNVVVDPNAPIEDPKATINPGVPIEAEVAGKIAEAKNVLIALSSDPSVDEMSTAIGLSLYLDKLGKRATAIYSGATPNALEFLKPEEAFESTADTLQDFVIALNKEKADHLRYKLDGDYVKIFITPYKTRISEDNLEFSYGDYNVDLVLALDVANGIDLDSALREHGRIMHDAIIVNITTGNPGKFGEIEWSDKKASSVAEMIANLIFGSNGSEKLGKEEATAFLTGIVAATNRFSNSSTTPATMRTAAKLIESGANQQLVSQNITADMENELFSINSVAEQPKEKGDPTELGIGHNPKDEVDENKEVEGTVNEKESSLLEDLKAAEASLAEASDAIVVGEEEAEKADNAEGTSKSDEPEKESSDDGLMEVTKNNVEPSNDTAVEEPEPATEVTSEPSSEPEPSADATTSEPEPEPTATQKNTSSAEEKPIEAPAGEKVIAPSDDFESTAMTLENENKYGKMLEDALDSVEEPASAANPAAMNAPSVPTNPEINGVPEMNYMPMPGEEILPPPPAPPIDMAGGLPSSEPVAPVAPTEPIAPATPTPEPTPEPLGDQPSMQDQVYHAQAADPAAFKIPGT